MADDPVPATSGRPTLARRLGTTDAVLIGLGSMIGAGVFAAFAPAARAAGTGLLLGLAVAALVAYCNATASAQLAAVHPASGGTYLYGRERLGPWWGYVAGWGFVVGKTASCAAMALTFASYAVPDPRWRPPVAVGAVLALAAVNYRGVTRTARLTRILVTVVLVVLALVVLANLTGGAVNWNRLTAGPFGPLPTLSAGAGPVADLLGHPPPAWYGVLQAAGLLFFAFAGYARIATMGEEVRNPARTIPRAVVGALLLTMVIYTAVGTSTLLVLGPTGLASAVAPLVDAVRADGWGWAVPVVRAGAAVAALGALLALIAGVGRTVLAMARERDLPGWLAAVHPRYRVPHRAEVVLAGTVCVVVLLVDLRGAIGFSSFGVLVYYLIANLSALTQPAAQRRYPRFLQFVGVFGCLALVATLPIGAVFGGLAVIAVGLGYRGIRLAVARRTGRDAR